jgi:hypothetical protein
MLMAAALMLAAAAPAAAPAGEMNLICRGTGSTMAATGRDTATVRNNQGYAVQGQNVRESLVNYETTAGFRLTGGLATMRVPTMFLPPIAGGRGGWFKVQDLRITDSEISGKVAINFMNKPSFRIDRITGELSTQYGFQAQCDAQDVNTRRF